MDRAKTVTEIKAAFLRTQVRLLSAILEPSRQWRDFAGHAEADNNLSDKVIHDVMSKVNAKLKEHNRAVYSAPSQRHVAEQIDALYWNIVSENDMQADEDAVVITRDADLTQTETIKSLPDSYSDLYIHPDGPSSSGSLSGTEPVRYTTLYDRLTSLAEQRDLLQQRLGRYKQLQALLEPFTNAQENIQPNLVTRDGELAKELERMRILLARVTGRVQEMKDAGVVTRSDGTGAVSDEQKLAAVMDLT